MDGREPSSQIAGQTPSTWAVENSEPSKLRPRGALAFPSEGRVILLTTLATWLYGGICMTIIDHIPVRVRPAPGLAAAPSGLVTRQLVPMSVRSLATASQAARPRAGPQRPLK